MIPEKVHHWLSYNGFGSITSSKAVSGGCISNGRILETAAGETFFLKTNQNSPPEMFAREAEGLKALTVPDAPSVPKPFLYDDNFLLMEDLKPAQRRKDYWPDFGRRMAALHNRAYNQFGFQHDNYIGSTPQPNPWTANGHVFFKEHRLRYQVTLAVERALLSRENARRLDKLADSLPELIPEQPASLIHGDLWGGNAMTDHYGGPAIIDPAAHFGWAEADLAMTALFGAFHEEFYRAYQEVRWLEPGFRERFPLYNLYHLLNHLNLFGSGYLSQVLGVIRRFS